MDSARRRFSGIRHLAPVLLLLVAAPGIAAAQTANASFPFLSMDDGQAASIWGAFAIQWALFSTYAANNVAALYFVALTAVLVGALSIVFVQKNQSFPTVASWLLLSIICLFAPYNSKLLFYDISKPTSQIGGAADLTLPDDQNTVMGFTPQLAAAHIGTTLQVIFVDLFKSTRMQSIVDSTLGKLALTNSPALDPGGSWLAAANDYIRQCPSDGILPASLLSTATSNDNQRPPDRPITFADALNMIDDSMAGPSRYGTKADFRIPPPVIELVDEESKLAPDQSAIYKAGIATLYQTLITPGTKVEIVQTETNDPTKLTLKQAVTKILENQTFEYNDTHSVLYYLQQAQTGTNSYASQQRQQMNAYCSKEASGGCNSLVTNYASANTPGIGGKYVNADLANFKTLPPVLAKMPVSMFVYSTAGGSILGRNLAGTSSHIEGQSITTLCDIKRGDTLFNSVFNGTDLYGNLDAVKQMIQTGNDIPAPGNWKVDDILTGFAHQTVGSNEYQIAKALTDILNIKSNWTGIATDQWNSTDAAVKLQKQKILANLIVSAAMKSAGANSADATNAKNTALQDMQPTVTGGVLANTLGKAASYLGDAAAQVGSIFAGSKAIATIYFLKVMIDIAIMGVIILTPIAFLVGLAMPNHAMGLLIQSFMVIFILKLVPVTFVIIDRTASFVYDAIGAIGGEQQGLKQALFLYAIAGLYGGLVGMTMFLLFKIGDPQNISKLTELDKAAEQAADAGMKLAQTLAVTTAGLLAVRPILGAISGWGVGGEEARSMKAQEAKGDAEMLRRAQALAAGPKTAEESGDIDSLLPPEDDGSGTPPFAPLQPVQPMPPGGGNAAANIGNVANMNLGGPQAGPNAPQPAFNVQNAQIQAAAVNPAQTAAPGAQINAASANIGDDDVKAHVENVDTLGDHAAEYNKQQVLEMKEAGANDAAAWLKEKRALNVKQGASEYAGVRKLYNDYKNTLDGTVTEAKAKAKRVLDADLLKAATPQATQKAHDKYNGQLQWIDRAAKENIAELDAAINADSGMLDKIVSGGDLARSRRLRSALSEKRSQGIKDGAIKTRLGYAMDGAWGSFRSGFSETGGALLNIPVLGEMLKPHLDEIYEGGQRARLARNMPGGWGEYWKNKKRAKYGEYFGKELGVQQKGMEYEQNLLSGTNYAQGQATLAQKAASEGAAKVAAEVRAALQNLSSRGASAFSVDDFMGANLVNAIDSLNKTIQQSMFIAKGAADISGGGQVQLTTGVLQKLSAGGATWAAAKPVESLFEGHLKGVEKDLRYKRDKFTDISSRTRGDVKAVAEGASMDMSTDYIDLFEINLVEKKAQFLSQAAQAKAYRGMMAMDAAMKKRNPKISSWDLPTGRIAAAANIDGQIRAHRRSTESLEESVVSQIRKSAKIPAWARTFDANPTAVQNAIQNLLTMQGMPAIPQNVMSNLGQAIGNVATNTRMKAYLANQNDRIGFTTALRDVLENMGIAQDDINDIIKRL
jgi:hypothetical protein